MNDIAAVQKRPGMYVGPIDDGSGPHSLLFAALNEAMAECLAGHATRIKLTINGDGSCTVEENGRGIVCATDHRGQTHGPDTVLTRLSILDKARSETEVWERSPVGLCPVNALSEWLEARLWRDGQESVMTFADGAPLAPMLVVGPAPLTDGEPRQGSAITFKPSGKVFPDAEWDAVQVAEWVSSMIDRYPIVSVELRDSRG